MAPRGWVAGDAVTQHDPYGWRVMVSNGKPWGEGYAQVWCDCSHCNGYWLAQLLVVINTAWCIQAYANACADVRHARDRAMASQTGEAAHAAVIARGPR